MRRRPLSIVVLLLLATSLFAAEDEPVKTVIGPTNPALYEGAQELMAGNGTEGVRLTLLGLKRAHGRDQEKVAHANLCAGFLLLQQAKTALLHCDWVLERYDDHWRTYSNRALVYLALEQFDEAEADIVRGQQLNPKSENLKEVKGMYLDEVEPVAERIVIDDRREGAAAPEAPSN